MNIIMQSWSSILFMAQDNVLTWYFKLSVGQTTLQMVVI